MSPLARSTRGVVSVDARMVDVVGPRMGVFPKNPRRLVGENASGPRESSSSSLSDEMSERTLVLMVDGGLLPPEAVVAVLAWAWVFFAGVLGCARVLLVRLE